MTAALDDNFGEPFQCNKCFRMQIVGIVDEQGDGLLGTLEQLLEVAFTPLALAGNRHRLVRRQVVEQGRDQQWHRDLCLLDRQRPRHDHPAFPLEFGAQTPRQDRLARPDDRGERDQAATEDGGPDVAQHLRMVIGFIEAGVDRRPGETVSRIPPSA